MHAEVEEILVKLKRIMILSTIIIHVLDIQ